MNIDKTIEILTDLSHPAEFTLSPDIKDAVELGIEALKARKRDRELGYVDLKDLLPGETQD